MVSKDACIFLLSVRESDQLFWQKKFFAGD